MRRQPRASRASRSMGCNNSTPAAEPVGLDAPTNIVEIALPAEFDAAQEFGREKAPSSFDAAVGHGGPPVNSPVAGTAAGALTLQCGVVSCALCAATTLTRLHVAHCGNACNASWDTGGVLPSNED